MPSTLLLLFGLWGCSGGGPSGSPVAVQDAPPPPAAIPEGRIPTGQASPDPLPLTAARLAPTIHSPTRPDAAVHRVLVHTLRPFADGSDLPEGTELTLDPALSNRVTLADASTLQVDLLDPIPPGTDLRVSLAALGTHQGPVHFEPPLTASFAAPAPALLNVTVAGGHPRNRTFTLHAHFSGRVDGLQAARALRVDGRSATPCPAPSPNTACLDVRADALSERTVSSDGSIRVAGVQAPASSHRVQLGSLQRPAAIVRDVHAEVSRSGTWIDVLCFDPAAEGSSRWQWRSGRGSLEASARCELDDASVDSLKLSPAVPFSVVPWEYGFRVLADLPHGPVQLTLDAGARTVDGSLIAGPVHADLMIPRRPTLIQLAEKGRYVGRDHWDALAVRHRNATALDVEVRHVPSSNLMFWLSGSDEAASERVANVIESARVPLQTEPDLTDTAWVSLKDLVPQPKTGIYEVTLRRGSASDKARLLVTDLQVLAKGRVGRPWDVWVLASADHAPRTGAEVSLVRASGAVIATCTTASDGHCQITPPTTDLDPAPPVALRATWQSDTTYLGFHEVQVQAPSEDIAGEAWDALPTWRAALHADRGVYRGGDEVHLTAILRGDDRAAPAAGLPAVLTIRDPRGRDVRRFALTTPSTGLITAVLPISDAAPTGRYTATLSVGDARVQSTTFLVEDFVPERMAVTAAAGDGHLWGDAVPVEVGARYLFGGSAADSPVEISCRVAPGPFAPPAAKSLHFGPADLGGAAPSAVELGTAAGTLGEDGTARLACPAPSSRAPFAQAGQLIADVRVLEAGGGRASRATARAPIHPAPYYLGLDTSLDRVEAGQPFRIRGEVVDWTGQPSTSAPDEVKVQLYELTSSWSWRYDPNTGDHSYHREERPVLQSTHTAAVKQGRFVVEGTAGSTGQGFLVRVSAGRADTSRRLTLDGGSWWWDAPGQGDVTPRAASPQQLSLNLPERIEVGSTHTLSFSAPYAGRALVTIETWGVQEHTWIDAAPGDNTWSFTLDDFTPTVYASVLLLRDPAATGPAAAMPTRAYGLARGQVSPTTWTLPLTLDVASEVRSQSTLTVQIDAGAPQAEVTLAVVDEGILSLTQHPSPEPLVQLFPARSLGVDTFETVGWTLSPRGAGPAGRTGGDGVSGPVSPQMVKPVALWSGVITTDGQGKATYEVSLPPYRGALRLMAVAATDTAVGAAQATVQVSDPLVVQATVPRFLSAGDEAEIPVQLTNTTSSRERVSLSMSVEPLDPFTAEPMDGPSPVRFEGSQSTQFSLEPGAARTFVFRATVLATAGGARVTVTAASPSHTANETLDMPIRPAGPEVRRTQTLTLDAGLTDLGPSLTGWTPTTEHTRVWVSQNPAAAALAHLGPLVRYPHGCLEQTVSATRPLLYADRLLPAAVGEVEGGSDALIAGALSRILSMQLPDGSFTTWPFGSHTHAWSTAYATHLLLDAHDAGHLASQAPIDDAVRWLQAQVKRDAARGDTTPWMRAREAYVHYVLAKAGRPLKARAAAVLDQILRHPDAKRADQGEAAFLLRAALYRAGDQRHRGALIAALQGLDAAAPRDPRTFYSPTRSQALVIDVLGELIPDADGLAAASRALTRHLAARSARSFTTQELGWGMAALARHAGEVGSGASPATLRVNGATAEGEPLHPDLNDRRFEIHRASEQRVQIHIDDPGTGPLTATLDTRGQRADAIWAARSQGVTVSRELLTPAGQRVDPAQIALGERVLVRLTLHNPTSAPLQDLALTDPVPGGFEIENPRLGDADLPANAYSEQAWSTEHLDLRDDRLSAFGALAAGQRVQVLYAARAVTAGVFHHPPVQVEAMYDPDIGANGAPGSVQITGDWEAFYF